MVDLRTKRAYKAACRSSKVDRVPSRVECGNQFRSQGADCIAPLLADFFFSSRRRHTRFDCDWSSDVCSSDLGLPVQGLGQSEDTKALKTAAQAALDQARKQFQLDELLGKDHTTLLRDINVIDRKSVV